VLQVAAAPTRGHDGRVIVDVATYRDGTRSEVEDLPSALAACRGSEDGFLWLGLQDPTAEELGRVAADLDLHHLAVEDAVAGHQRPKVEHYDDTVFVVLKVLAYFDETSTVETSEVMLFVGDRFVVTVRRGAAGSLHAVREAVERDPRRLHRGPKAVLHAVMEHVVREYTRIDEELERDVDQVEEQVFSPDRSSDAERIYSLKREVLEVRRAAAPLVAPLTTLVAGGREDGQDGAGRPVLDRQSRFVLRDVLDNLTRTVEHVESYDRLLTDILNAHLAQVSVRQNDDMRKISAWAAIAAVPTLVAGVYGMNFEHMPELSWRFGYPACLLAMVAICAGLYRTFKRSGWL
jgi:magnesium transporter